MKYDEDIEKMLRIDSITKKKSGRGVFNRASRLGYCRGGIKFPSDFLSNKEKKQLNGEVRCYSMYEDIKNVPTKKELLRMNKEKALAILLEARKHHRQKELTKQIGVSTGSLYSLYDHFGVPYTKYGDRIPKVEKKHSKGIELQVDTVNEVEELKTVQAPVEVKSQGFEIRLSGEYNKVELTNKLNSICTILDNSKKYVINIEVKEV